MTWNWQPPDWPDFSWNKTSFVKAEALFLVELSLTRPAKFLGQLLAEWTRNLIFGTECCFRIPDKRTGRTMSRSWKEFLPHALFGTISFACVLGYFYFEEWSDRQQADASRLEQAEEAVSVLPPGVENAWIGYVDRRVKSSIIQKGDMIQIIEKLDDGSTEMTFVPPKTAYQVSCGDTIGAIAVFGPADDSGNDYSDGNDTESANSLSTTIFEPFTGYYGNSNIEPPPALGVEATSVAANNLLTVLCQRVLVDVRKAMDTPSAETLGK